MKISYKISMLGIVLLITTFLISCPSEHKSITFWDAQRRGANTFTPSFSKNIVDEATEFGINFIRLAPDKWQSQARDFLIGDADHYQGLIPEDVAKLKEVLGYFEEAGLPVVITMLSLPGSRWRQNNGGKDDLRLWESQEYQMQAQQFWMDLATELKDFECVVGYNILNEPHLDLLWQKNINDEALPETLETIQQCLATFYQNTIMAIRQADPDTFIILDASWYADARTMPLMATYSEPRILYSFHMYEPYAYTNWEQNQGNYSYPEDIEVKEGMSAEAYFAQFINSVKAFQKKHGIPNERILVGEFGVNRRAPGAQQYLQDLIALYNEENWHWAVYAFSDLDWDGMDYRLGTEPLPAEAWPKEGEPDYAAYYVPNSLFDVLKEAWAR